MKKTILIITVILVCAFVFAGCQIQLGGGGKTAIEMSSDTGDVESLPDTLTASKGSTFAFSLEGDDAKGFTWQVVIEDEEIIILKSSEYAAEDPDAGGSAITTLTFTALDKGETKLTLTFAQDGEGGETDKTKEILVVIE